MSTDLITPVESKEAFLSIPVTPAMIEKFKGYPMKIEDITDKKALKIVHDRRMELRNARTATDKARKKMNEDARAEIERNNAIYKAVLEELAPIEEALRAEEERVEKAIEDMRVAAANKLCQERMDQFAEIGYEVQEQAVRAMSADAFESALLMARGVVAERARLAAIAKEQEAERLRLEQERQAEFERQEAERMKQQAEEAERQRVENERLEAERQAAEAERMKQQAEEDAARKAEADRLEAEKKAFEEERQRVQAEIDRQRAEMAAMLEEQAERERKAAEEKRLAEEQELLAKQRAQIAAEQAERERLRLEREAEEKRLAEERAEADRVRLEAMKPDIQKLSDYVAKLEKVKVPDVSDAGRELADRVCQVFLGAITAMNAIVGK